MGHWLRKLSIFVIALGCIGAALTTFLPVDGPIQNTDGYLSIVLLAFAGILAAFLGGLSYWHDHQQSATAAHDSRDSD